MKLEVEEWIIPFDTVLFDRWKNRDPHVVTEKLLAQQGPGIFNGYGFGEWVAENFFVREGYKVINNEFNMVAGTSKYTENNALITNMVGKEKVERFKQEVRHLTANGVKVVSHLDLFVYNHQENLFAEVKRGRDRIRKEQLIFMHLVQEIMESKAMLIYLDDQISNVVKKNKTFEFELL